MRGAGLCLLFLGCTAKEPAQKPSSPPTAEPSASQSTSPSGQPSAQPASSDGAEHELKPVLAASPVEGSLDAGQIWPVLNAHRPKMHRCAEERGAKGMMKIALTIARSGKVKSAKAEDVKGFDAAVAECILARAREMVFPEATSETNLTFPVKVS